MSIDNVAWEAIEKGWTQPIGTGTDGTKQLEGKAYYIAEEKRMVSENSKSLNTIFSNVDMEQFKFILMYESAKEAWTVLLNQDEDITALKLNEMIGSHRNFELNY
ncbi:hypothetical protein J1N35_014107 [Gossypium stocksii]|uniref:Uncharacterized protein n=1 Tax=Gossypium stocksii TaxID=47602 RepID=A0A9D3VVW6_9ROSI|nr:hypothetical protein J1N35_014107 [Gossypium stocksii]